MSSIVLELPSLSSFTPHAISPSTLLSPIPLSFVTNLVLAQFLHPQSEFILGAYVLTNLGLFASAINSGESFLNATLHSVLNNIIFLSSLFLFTAIRRIYFHPLSKFPGPKLRAATSLLEAWDNLQGQWPKVVLSHHRYYNSPIIRIGPNELSILDADGLPTLYPRNSSHNSRGVFYNFGKVGGPSLENCQDDKLHRKMRKVWDLAFSGKALGEYGVRLGEHVERLVGTIKERVDVKKGTAERETTKMCAGFSFDIMADLVYGVGNYGMQDETGDFEYMDIMHQFMSMVAFLGGLRDLMDILSYLPLPPIWGRFRKLQITLLKARMEMGADARKDVYSELIRDPDTGAERAMDDILADLDLVVVAGSDTTASALTHCLYEICRTPSIQTKIFTELQSRFTSPSEITASSAKNLPYLDAVINETLRLWPPSPPGIQARVSPQGAIIGDHFIPPNTLARVPHWSIMRDERYFRKAEEFVPERWLGNASEKHEDEPAVMNRAAFIPFSYGPHVCVGKALAMMEMRQAIARLVWEFEMRYGEKWDEKKFFDGWKDHFTVSPGEVWVEFKPRGMAWRM